jgi:hypothetical protein
MKKTVIKIRNIAIAMAFVLVILGVAVRPAFADPRHHGGDEHREHHEHGWHRDGNRYVPEPSYYYAPQPNYYYVPEPDQYYYSSPPDYYPPPPSQGINLFFGIP